MFAYLRRQAFILWIEAPDNSLLDYITHRLWRIAVFFDLRFTRRG